MKKKEILTKNMEDFYNELHAEFVSTNPDDNKLYIIERLIKMAMEMGAIGGFTFGFVPPDAMWFKKGLEEIVWLPHTRGEDNCYGKIIYKMDYKGVDLFYYEW